MSLWSRLGLIDRKNFLSLQTELLELRNENKIIAEQNKKYLEEVICLHSSKINNRFCSEIEVIKANIAAMSAKVIEVNGAIGGLNTYLHSAVEENKCLMIDEGSKNRAAINEAFKVASGELCKVNANGKESLTDIKNVLERLAVLIEMLNTVSEKNEIMVQVSADTKLLSESLSNLWTIMKAIWVDSVLTDINEVTDNRW